MKIEIFSVDDWAKLFVDGELKMSAHSISVADIFEILDLDARIQRAEGTALEAYAEVYGDFPDTLKECLALLEKPYEDFQEEEN